MVWDKAARRAIPTTRTDVDVRLAQPAKQIEIFDPLGGAEPVRSESNSDRVTASLEDHPLILKVH